MSHAPARRRYPSAAWEALTHALRMLATAFGVPGELWAAGALRAADARRLRAWIGALEALARALLVELAARRGLIAQAAASRATSSLPAFAPAHPETAAPGAGDADPDAALAQSERWLGVGFRYLPDAARARSEEEGGGAHAGAPHGGPRRFADSRALAFRFESLIRVAERPGRCARKMARRLARRAEAAGRILAPLPDRSPTARPTTPPPYAPCATRCAPPRPMPGRGCGPRTRADARRGRRLAQLGSVERRNAPACRPSPRAAVEDGPGRAINFSSSRPAILPPLRRRRAGRACALASQGRRPP